MRRILKHPVTGMRFRSTGSVEWPNDSFTQRRLRSGSITLAPKDDKPNDGDESSSSSAHHRRPHRSHASSSAEPPADAS